MKMAEASELQRSSDYSLRAAAIADFAKIAPTNTALPQTTSNDCSQSHTPATPNSHAVMSRRINCVLALWRPVTPSNSQQLLQPRV